MSLTGKSSKTLCCFCPGVIYIVSSLGTSAFLEKCLWEISYNLSKSYMILIRYKEIH